MRRSIPLGAVSTSHEAVVSAVDDTNEVPIKLPDTVTSALSQFHTIAGVVELQSRSPLMTTVSPLASNPTTPLPPLPIEALPIVALELVAHLVVEVTVPIFSAFVRVSPAESKAQVALIQEMSLVLVHDVIRLSRVTFPATVIALDPANVMS